MLSPGSASYVRSSDSADRMECLGLTQHVPTSTAADDFTNQPNKIPFTWRAQNFTSSPKHYMISPLFRIRGLLLLLWPQSFPPLASLELQSNNSSLPMRADGQGFVMWKHTATEVGLHQRRGVRTATEALFRRSEAIQDFAPRQEASFPWPVARGQGLSIFWRAEKARNGSHKE